MRHLLLFSSACLTLCAPIAAAQQATAKPKPATHHAAGLKLADLKGTWSIETTVKTAAGTDTVVTDKLTATASRKGWVTHLADRPAIPERIVAIGGDSVVMAAGPFKSVVRAGQTVRTHQVLHFKGDSTWGTIQARYSTGQVVNGTLRGTRKP